MQYPDTADVQHSIVGPNGVDGCTAQNPVATYFGNHRTATGTLTFDDDQKPTRTGPVGTRFNFTSFTLSLNGHNMLAGGNLANITSGSVDSVSLLVKLATQNTLFFPGDFLTFLDSEGGSLPTAQAIRSVAQLDRLDVASGALRVSNPGLWNGFLRFSNFSWSTSTPQPGTPVPAPWMLLLTLAGFLASRRMCAQRN
ncbi:MAG: hypothetical protein AAF513_12470 [Pseudomonadota bacterium]